MARGHDEKLSDALALHKAMLLLTAQSLPATRAGLKAVLRKRMVKARDYDKKVNTSETAFDWRSVYWIHNNKTLDDLRSRFKASL